MTLIEGFIRDNVFIDFGVEPVCGSDQADISYPVRFPTVGFQLYPTEELSRIADRVRKASGYIPYDPMDENTYENSDLTGWYEFTIGINGFTPTHLDSVISFIEVGDNHPDSEVAYTIDLTEEEQKAVYDCLNEQCRKYLGKGCEDLLGEARMRMGVNST